MKDVRTEVGVVPESPQVEQTAVQAAEQPAPQASTGARSRVVLVTGATGLVGSHTCRELARRGWTIRAIVRSPTKAGERLAGVPVQTVLGDLRSSDTVRAAVRGVDAIVHLAAIAIERRDESYEDVNTGTTIALVEAARAEGVRRFVHMSQNGSSSASPYRFLRSKGAAQDAVQASDLEWTVLRPSVIFGPEDEFVTVLARLVRLSPVVYPLPGGGTARFQPVFVDDVARVIATALERPGSVRQTYPMGGPAALTLRQMIERVLLAMHTERVLIPAPVFVLRPLIAAAQYVLPRPPVTTSLLDLLAVDNTVGDAGVWSTFRVVPVPFAPEELTYLRNITVREAWRSLW
ncbi:MAG TPA: complex I NDUFA9 subunit family protein [Gemmatimonadaceae bacterium]|nr:complex I NDUFA9 subunit family protein [Gemmatimonadaceae bacterium]